MAEKAKSEGVREGRVTYVGFRDPVPISVGEYASIEFWSELKHGKIIQCQERGNWITLLWLDGKSGNPGRARVPMTNVAVIKETLDVEA